MSETAFPNPYPGYDVLEKRDSPSWNAVTRKVVEKRLREVPPRRFFSADEWAVLEAVCRRLLPQPDRPDDPIPIVPWIDDKLSRGQGDGYRFEDMPRGEEAWRKGLRGLEEESLARFGRGFAALVPSEQDELLDRIRRGEVSGPSWTGMSAKRFFAQLLLKDAVAVYYAHPAAWSEIGFGGPAAPRGYVRLGFDEADPWEAQARPSAEGSNG